ncbi:hypothetical protein VNO77_31830 [Canavalia gladiata]|uniref:Uncharacterized protein n=1 Tax=Canavalia gladiata TaxID=3824 RepID=A0AAN9KQ03_CANGL
MNPTTVQQMLAIVVIEKQCLRLAIMRDKSKRRLQSRKQRYPRKHMKPPNNPISFFTTVLRLNLSNFFLCPSSLAT